MFLVFVFYVFRSVMIVKSVYNINGVFHQMTLILRLYLIYNLIIVADGVTFPWIQIKPWVLKKKWRFTLWWGKYFLDSFYDNIFHIPHINALIMWRVLIYYRGGPSIFLGFFLSDCNYAVVARFCGVVTWSCV